ncbi:MAG: DUF3467 domain-containing protein [bacterium]|nr:DUF3467 domain-containing protein [bacterium]
MTDDTGGGSRWRWSMFACTGNRARNDGARQYDASMEHSPEDGTPVILPPDVNPAGVYANGFGVWGTPIDFTVDFVAGPFAPDDSSQIVVARVRLAPQTVAGLHEALGKALDEHIRSQDLSGVHPDATEEPR